MTPSPSASSNGTSPDAPDERGDTTIVVDDPEDFAKTRMLRSIFDALDNYRKTRRKAQKLEVRPDNGFGEEEKRKLVFGAMQEVLLTAEPLLRGTDGGEELWTERRYRLRSTVVGLSPSDTGEYANSLHQRKSASAVMENGSQTVEGMAAFVNGTSFYAHVTEPYDQIIRAAPGTETCNAPVRDAQQHLSDVGLGVDLSTEQQTKISEDTLEEVEEWRQRNI